VIHQEFVLPFLKRLGFVVQADKLSCVDMQVLIDVPISDFIDLLNDGHVVTQLRKKAVYGAR